MTLRRKENDGLKRQDYLVLNSVSNIHKALEPLSHYENIQCFLDNDEAGRKAYQALLADCKDLNEFLCRQNRLLQKPVREQRRGLKS